MDGSADLSDEEILLFADRIERGLASRPLAIDSHGHRRVVADLISRVGDSSLYDFLGVGAGASQAEILDAYERIARLVHPRHARAIGLQGKEGVLALLFERATEAYLTLSHTDRRKRYDSELGALPWKTGISGEVRGEEERQVARRYFVRANILAASEEYHMAIELLRQAARIDPRPEYFALLGQLEAKNPNWLRLAEENLNRAVELGGGGGAVAAALAKVREQRTAAAAEAAAVDAGKAGVEPAGKSRLFFRKK